MGIRDWARSKGNSRSSAPAAAPAPAPAAPTSQVAPPPAPPGMGYVWNGQYGAFMLVPLSPPAAQPPSFYPAGTMPMPVAAPPPPFAPPAGASGGTMGRILPFPNMTSQIVKPGDVDNYATLLASAPELVPPSGYDASIGNPSPDSLAALAESGRGGASHTIRNLHGIAVGSAGGGGVPAPQDTPAFPRPLGANAHGPELGAVPAPQSPWVSPDPKAS